MTYLTGIQILKNTADLVIGVNLILLVEWHRDTNLRKILYRVLREYL